MAHLPKIHHLDGSVPVGIAYVSVGLLESIAQAAALPSGEEDTQGAFRSKELPFFCAFCCR